MVEEVIGSDDVDVEDPESILKSNEDIRQKLIKGITKDGIPSDNKDRRVLIEVLNSSDTTAIGRMRIKADVGIADTQAQAASIIANLLNDQNFRKIKPTQGSEDFVVSNGEVPDSVPVPKVIDGELSERPTIVDYETFTKNGGKSR